MTVCAPGGPTSATVATADDMGPGAEFELPPARLPPSSGARARADSRAILYPLRIAHSSPARGTVRGYLGQAIGHGVVD